MFANACFSPSAPRPGIMPSQFALITAPKRLVSAIQAAISIVKAEGVAAVRQHSLRYVLRRANCNTAPTITYDPPNRCDKFGIGSAARAVSPAKF
eukprot:scaffold19371_cov34-Prasinocladus_malaysianus.AAC.2